MNSFLRERKGFVTMITADLHNSVSLVIFTIRYLLNLQMKPNYFPVIAIAYITNE